MTRVLVVEDEQHLAEGLRFNLEAEGFEVAVTETGEEALALFTGDEAPFGLLVLDVMLPGIDGFEVIGTLRAKRHFLPTLMLTARGRSEDVVRGIAAGADDYLAKPFELSVLIARIKGLLRRRDWVERPPVDQARINNRTVDFRNLEITYDGERYALTLLEINLLRFLLEHQGKTVTRGELLENVWQVHEDTDTRVIDNFVVRLRRYLEDEPARPTCLLTVGGGGYRLGAFPSE